MAALLLFDDEMRTALKLVAYQYQPLTRRHLTFD